MRATALLLTIALQSAPANAEEIASSTLPLRVHFAADDDPDFARIVLEAAEEAWAWQVDETGFRAPPPDAGAFGTDDYDIFVGATPWIAVTSAGVPAAGRPFGVTSSILVDRGIPAATVPLVVSHEFQHAIHLGTCAWGNDVQEAAAVAVSGLHRDGDAWRLGYYLGFDDFQAHPDRSVDWIGALGDYYAYGAALFLSWAAQTTDRSGATFVRDLWGVLEADGCPSLLEGVDAFLDVDARFVEFARARWFVGPHDDGRHIADLERWEGPGADQTIDPVSLAADLAAGDLPFDDALLPAPMPYGAAYVRVSVADFAPDESVAVSFEGADDVRWRIGTIETRTDGPAVEGEVDVPADGRLSFELAADGAEAVVLVVANLGDGTHEGFPEDWVPSDARIRVERVVPPVPNPAHDEPPPSPERSRQTGCSSAPTAPSPASIAFLGAVSLLGPRPRRAMLPLPRLPSDSPKEPDEHHGRQ